MTSLRFVYYFFGSFLFPFKFYSLRSVVAVLIITIRGAEAVVVEVEEDSQHRRGAK